MSTQSKLFEALQKLTDHDPIVSDAEEGSYCFYCYAKWDQARAQFGDGQGMVHATKCDWLAARAALSAALPLDGDAKDPA